LVKRLWTFVIAVATLTPVSVPAQRPPGTQNSSNVQVLSHLPLGRIFTVSDVEVEQELSRPYVYVSRMLGRFAPEAGFDIVDVKNPSKARLLYRWRIPNAELHQGGGGMATSYVKSRGRYYDIQSFQFNQSGPDADLGAVVFDVTGLPDTSTIREVARIELREASGGFHEIFAYKHSTGRPVLFTTTQSPYGHIYDIDRLVAGDSRPTALLGRIPIPDTTGGGSLRAYHDMYAAYDPVSRQDRFYGAGASGYYVFDVTDLANPRLLTSVTGVAGMRNGHTFTVTPDGRYGILETEYQYAALRIVDLKPGLDGQVSTISRPIGAWISDWTTNPHNIEIRWPYVFVAAYEEGLQIVGDPELRWRDPSWPIPPPYAVLNGAWGIDVRNADGLIVIGDLLTGFWTFKMGGFDGWNGHQWGMPNASSAQDWDHGPDGAKQ
jgi:hypothetical protein